MRKLQLLALMVTVSVFLVFVPLSVKANPGPWLKEVKEYKFLPLLAEEDYGKLNVIITGEPIWP